MLLGDVRVALTLQGTQRLLCTVPECTMEEIQHAVEVGEIAQPEWAAFGFQVRREYLLRLIESLRELSSDIVRSSAVGFAKKKKN